MSGPHRSEAVPRAATGERLDRFVAMLADCSRSEAAELLAGGGVEVDGEVVTRGSRRLSEDEVVSLATDPRGVPLAVEADPSVRFGVVHVDDDVIVVDKPAGLVVHPGPGHRTGTLVNGLLARYPEIAAVGEPDRPGIVHRLDRMTSGLLVVARSPRAHAALVAEMADHSVERTYSALVLGHPDAGRGVVDAPIGRSRRDPLKMTVAVDGRPARTRFGVERTFEWPSPCALLTCDLETGRTHQIRVHLASIGHPVAGDDAYGGRRPDQPGSRPFLHARRLSLVHPGGHDRITVTSPLPRDLQDWLETLR